MAQALFRFTGPLPDLNRIYSAELDLASDRQWLIDHPKAVARVRLIRDDTRTVKQMVLLACRVLDQTAPDGWCLAYHEGHYGHRDGIPFDMWSNYPSLSNANRLALNVLSGDADADAGSAMMILGGIVVPDLSECDPFWQQQFTPLASDDFTSTLKIPDPMEDKVQFTPQKNFVHGMPENFSFADEEKWFDANQQRIFRLHHVQTEHGHLAYPTGPQRPEVAGLDPNARVFLTACIEDLNAPLKYRVIIHEVSLPALAEFGFDQYHSSLDAENFDHLALRLLEIELRLGNPSALNILRFAGVPTDHRLSESDLRWLLSFQS